MREPNTTGFTVVFDARAVQLRGHRHRAPAVVGIPQIDPELAADMPVPRRERAPIAGVDTVRSV